MDCLLSNAPKLRSKEVGLIFAAETNLSRYDAEDFKKKGAAEGSQKLENTHIAHTKGPHCDRFKISHRRLCCLVEKLFFSSIRFIAFVSIFSACNRVKKASKASIFLSCHCYFHCSHCW